VILSAPAEAVGIGYSVTCACHGDGNGNGNGNGNGCGEQAGDVRDASLYRALLRGDRATLSERPRAGSS
jgi:hypothetical protein